MSDLVVTVPWDIWPRWLAEGDTAGTPWSGQESSFYLASHAPAIDPGERVYVVARGLLRGYAPLVRIDRSPPWRVSLVRHGGAQAVTIRDAIRGFRGFRYRWWNLDREIAFPDWQVVELSLADKFAEAGRGQDPQTAEPIGDAVNPGPDMEAEAEIARAVAAARARGEKE